MGLSSTLVEKGRAGSGGNFLARARFTGLFGAYSNPAGGWLFHGHEAEAALCHSCPSQAQALVAIWSSNSSGLPPLSRPDFGWAEDL